ncbi:hypothetical protein MLD38_035326 [Melastoma candidum]|uniref:Uncharacterized protein n=1 Tax=Melastoma candidum TaxID=119954 RepID=A0ACB9LGR6_9MYRT|nr:hypothetical protein MLD38_035326 [Melastoma candidum]
MSLANNTLAMAWLERKRKRKKRDYHWKKKLRIDASKGGRSRTVGEVGRRTGIDTMSHAVAGIERGKGIITEIDLRTMKALETGMVWVDGMEVERTGDPGMEGMRPGIGTESEAGHAPQ